MLRSLEVLGQSMGRELIEVPGERMRVISCKPGTIIVLPQLIVSVDGKGGVKAYVWGDPRPQPEYPPGIVGGPTPERMQPMLPPRPIARPGPESGRVGWARDPDTRP